MKQKSKKRRHDVKEESKKCLQIIVHGRSKDQESKEVKQRRPRSPDPLEADNLTRTLVSSHGVLDQCLVMLASFAPKKQLVALKMILKKSNRSNYETIRKEVQLLKIARPCPFLCHSHTAFQSELYSVSRVPISHSFIICLCNQLYAFAHEYASGGTIEKMIRRK
ncbi:hypothetical protein XELAEV_18015320mg [Xenopus laevis]|uniref:Protein kinase domain-containing protein n=1 Tax=Xenopus laevis TaxID=8355 RepID=A0A974DHT5_XENLA|nr:hypothetical protein XELAEV_18015320mg [Xenopus laevis]